MTDRDPMLAGFDVLIGTWSTEAKHRLVDEIAGERHVRVARRRALPRAALPQRARALSERDLRHRPPRVRDGHLRTVYRRRA
jgi:hypothetical protein